MAEVDSLGWPDWKTPYFHPCPLQPWKETYQAKHEEIIQAGTTDKDAFAYFRQDIGKRMKRHPEVNVVFPVATAEHVATNWCQRWEMINVEEAAKGHETLVAKLVKELNTKFDDVA